MKQALVSWKGGMAFEARTGSDHTVTMDARPEVGGEDRGPRPTELLLAALGGCTGMDVVSILRKMRVPFERVEVAVEADERAEHPRYFERFRLVYRVFGPDVSADQVRRAVELSETRYCSVAGLFRHGAEISYRIEINGEAVD
ncbi:putative redox protein [Symbiobacterium terraclitae]|uniref:Redox protein n=1 Tax=Symbiobacterium terraclitae TaxID=557451 RepID=A0ABS4JWU7_9FIRM|nr:OsmC family protein [Symbiobacterium terraclitae]MBP2020012.1 putative redox protein [Symbiobacterium terraclitae]